MTWNDLAEKIDRMHPLERNQPVELRDYQNQETHTAIDCIALAKDPLDRTEVNQFQIGFNEYKY